MSRTVSVRPFASAEWRTYRTLRLRSLADSPDAFGSTLAREEGRADAHWSARLASGEDRRFSLLLVAEIEARALGLAYGRIEADEPEVASLYQMWVAPEGRGLGAGRMLVDVVVEWATARKARTLKLGVTLDNGPAMRLYQRAGFQPVGEPGGLREGSPLLGQPMELAPPRAAG